MSSAIERVSRQLLLPQWNLAKQRRFEGLTLTTQSRFGLAALYLTGSGIRRHRVVECNGRLAAEWVRRITELAPESTVEIVEATGEQAALSLTEPGPGGDVVVSLSVEQLGGELHCIRSAAGGIQQLLLPEGAVKADSIGELFLSAALATVALREFVQHS